MTTVRRRPVAKVSVSLPSDLLARVDALQEARGETRSEIFREALTTLLKAEQERLDEERYARAYREHPQSEEELAWVKVGLETLADLPWDDPTSESGHQ